jgi:hypothetical protein
MPKKILHADHPYPKSIHNSGGPSRRASRPAGATKELHPVMRIDVIGSFSAYRMIVDRFPGQHDSNGFLRIILVHAVLYGRIEKDVSFAFVGQSIPALVSLTIAGFVLPSQAQ